MLAGSAHAGADPLHRGVGVSASTAQLLPGLESFLGEPLRALGGMAQLEVGGGLVGSSREGKGLGAAPWGADLSPLCFSQPCLSSGTRVCSGQALFPLHNHHFCVAGGGGTA